MKQHKKLLITGLTVLGLMMQAAAPACASELIIDEGGPVVEEFPEEENQAEPQSDTSGNTDAAGDTDEVDFDALFEGEETITFENSEMTAQDVAALAGDGVLPEEEVFLLRADQANVRYSLEQLLSVPDPIGSDGELEIASFIKTTMLSLGYTVSEQAFHEGRLNENGIDPPGVNIIAERGADAQERTNGILILCAHYDSKSLTDEEMSDEEEAPIDALAVVAQEAQNGQASPDASEAQNDPEVQNGPEAQNAQKAPRPISVSENDKSGAAVLLETARILAQEETAMDICFVFLSGEEDGYYGSEHIAQWLSDEQRSRVQGVICLGELGAETEEAPVYLLGTVDGEENSLTANIRACAEKLGYGNGLRQPQKEEDILAEALDFAQSGMNAEMPPQGETADAGSEMGEAAFDETPANWSTAVLPSGSHTAFAKLGIPAVCIFQDTEETFRIVDGRVTEEPEETEAVTEADTDMEAESGETGEAQAGADADGQTDNADEQAASDADAEAANADAAQTTADAYGQDISPEAAETADESEAQAAGESDAQVIAEDKLSSAYALSQIADLMAEAVFLYMQ